MDIAQIVADRQRHVDTLRDEISAKELAYADEIVVLGNLQNLQLQSSFSIDDINYLLEHRL